MSSDQPQFPVLRGRAITVDENGLVCLNDIWRAGGFTVHQTPSQWQRLPFVVQLITALLERNMGKSHVSKITTKSVIYAIRGQGGGTYADRRLAIAYAEYLSPKFALEVKDVFLRYMDGDPTLADDILQRASPEANEWAGRRAIGRAIRKGFTGVLRNHGVSRPQDFALVTNAVYRGLFDKTAQQLKTAKGVSKGGNLRDSMDLRELAYVMASEALSSESIEQQQCDNAIRCQVATMKSTSHIRTAIDADRKGRRGAQQRLL